MKYRITPDGALETSLSGFDLINFPMLNKGTAFTEASATVLPARTAAAAHRHIWRTRWRAA